MKNQTGKYFKYAIGEIILVVIGILIALQINNWNQSRINSNLEKQYLKTFRGFKRRKSNNRATINYSLIVQRHAEKAMLIFEDTEKRNENSVESLVNLYQASQIQNPTSAKSTYQELIASSQINLIKNDNLKTSLIRYYEYNWTESLHIKFNK